MYGAVNPRPPTLYPPPPPLHSRDSGHTDSYDMGEDCTRDLDFQQLIRHSPGVLLPTVGDSKNAAADNEISPRPCGPRRLYPTVRSPMEPLYHAAVFIDLQFYLLYSGSCLQNEFLSIGAAEGKKNGRKKTNFQETFKIFSGKKKRGKIPTV